MPVAWVALSTMLAVMAWPGGLAAAPKVVASIAPVHSLVAGVMVGVGAPVLLVEAGRSPHATALRPSHAQALAAADVVFWVGPDLETFLVGPLAALASGARVVELVAAPGLVRLPGRAGGIRLIAPAGDAHPGEVAMAGPGDRGHADTPAGLGPVGAMDSPASGPEGPARATGHGHDPGGLDPHVWLDPHNASAMVGAIVEALSATDPGNADRYQANGAALDQRLATLDADLERRLGTVRQRPFIVFHDAFQYLERRYRLSAVGALAVDPERRPGARRLAEIRHALTELEVVCLFVEPQFEPALVQTVVDGTGARLGVLDPLGADIAPGPDHYARAMTALADALLDCLA